MSQTTVTRKYQGKALEAVPWEALLRIFDALFGESARSLPKYPEVIGFVNGEWIDAQNMEHKAQILEDIEQAYNKFETASITFTSLNEKAQKLFFKYWPSKAEAFTQIEASDKTTADGLISAVSKEFPLIERYVFISYDTAEYDLATFIAEVVENHMGPGINVFVAKRDISAGENPLKVMLDEQLLQAEALLALCSSSSKNSPWLWWESSAVWAKGGLVIPLFVDISPNEFNGPITLVCQGRSLFDVEELNAALNTLITRVFPSKKDGGLTQEEQVRLQKFQQKAHNQALNTDAQKARAG
jgi:hypothetical protein